MIAQAESAAPAAVYETARGSFSEAAARGAADPSDAFISWILDVRGFSPKTASTYRSSIADFRKTMDVADFSSIGPADIDRYLRRLALRGLYPNTRRTRLNALRGLFAFLVSRGHVQADPTVGYEGPRLKNLEVVPTFSTREIERLIFSFPLPQLSRGRKEPSAIFRHREEVARLKHFRDTALLAVAYSAGLRASEVGRLGLKDWAPRGAKAFLVLRDSKWASEPTVSPIDNRVAATVEAFLHTRFEAGINHPALFPPVSGRRQDTKSPDEGVGRNQFAALLARRVEIAGIELKGRRLSPHTLRYSIATHLHEGGLPDPELQVFMRHRSFETTLRYIRLGSSRQIRRRANRTLYWNRRTGMSPSSLT